jgi:SAM-dependent methyltransferase
MQEHAWEKEYRNPKLVTKEARPQASVLEFLRYLRKKEKIELDGLKACDLGCGTGRNSNHLAEHGSNVVGMEISTTALDIAKARAEEKNLNVQYLKQSIGMPYPFEKNEFDLALDVTSSNSLSEAERETYLKETWRVLKPGGFLFVRALCKDGDSNAKTLLKTNPGKEKDTYILPKINVTERVFSKDDFEAAYSPYFEIIFLKKETHYARFEGRVYKRNYWIAYLKKK